MMKKEQFKESLKDPLVFWKGKTYEEVERLLGKQTATMVGFEQRNPHHCYDLFEHTLYTTAGVGENASYLLQTAAFFHDIGKPLVKKEKQGRFVFHGHAKKSAEIAVPILESMQYSEEEIREICFYITHHDDFISWVLPEEKCDAKNSNMVEITESNVERYVSKTEDKLKEQGIFLNRQMLKNLVRLCRADISAQAEQVIREGKIIDSKEHKLKKIEVIADLLNV